MTHSSNSPRQSEQRSKTLETSVRLAKRLWWLSAAITICTVVIGVSMGLPASSSWLRYLTGIIVALGGLLMLAATVFILAFEPIPPRHGSPE